MRWLLQILAGLGVSLFTVVPTGAELCQFSGLLGTDDDGKIPQSFGEEVKLLFQNMTQAIEKAGIGPSQVTRIEIFIVTSSELQFNERSQIVSGIWQSFFPGKARAVIGASYLAKGARIEAVMDGWR